MSFVRRLWFSESWTIPDFEDWPFVCEVSGSGVRAIRVSDLLAPSSLEEEAEEARATPGALLSGVLESLCCNGVSLPDKLQRIADRTTSGEALTKLGHGSVVVIDRQPYYATEWVLDGYRAAVTIHDRHWLCVLLPSDGATEVGDEEHMSGTTPLIELVAEPFARPLGG